MSADPPPDRAREQWHEQLISEIEKRIPLLTRMLPWAVGNDPNGIREVAQQVFLNLEDPRWASHIEHIDRYIYRVARNWALGQQAKRANIEFDSELADLTLDGRHEDNLRHIVHSRDIELDVQAALAELPQELRDALLLHYVYGYSIEEIERETGLSNATVRREITQARSMMEHLLAVYRKDGR